MSRLGLLNYTKGAASSLPVVIITLKGEESASSVDRLTAMLWWTF